MSNRATTLLLLWAMCAASLLLPAGARAENIVVGQIGPFSGLPSPDATEVRDGAQAYFDLVNASGGIRGRKIAMFTLDDTFKGDVFVERFKQALSKRPVALISPIGSAAMTKLLKDNLLDAADIVVLNAIPGAEAFRQPGHLKLFHIRAGDKAQLDRILTHCKTLGVLDVHVFRQDLPIGEAGLAVVKATTASMGGFKVDSTTSTHTDAALQDAAKNVAGVRPQGILVVGTPKFMADAIHQVRLAGAGQAVFALSYLPTPLAVKIVGADAARGLSITQTFPNPNSRNLPLQREFQDAMNKSKPEITTYSPFHLEGYVTARTFVAAARRIEGMPTPATLAKALHEMGELDLGGFRVNFGKGNVGSAWTDIGVISGYGKLIY
jgi:branched-chain amino acid transport system substrate-binding protein